VDRGVPLVGLEPSCLLTLRDELVAMLPGEEAARVAGAALTFEFNVERPPADANPKIGIVAQSGAVAAIMRMAFRGKGLGVTFYISTGNEADLTAEDFLGALIDDAETQVAALLSYLRELQRRFQVAILLVHHARKDSNGSRPGSVPLPGTAEP